MDLQLKDSSFSEDYFYVSSYTSGVKYGVKDKTATGPYTWWPSIRRMKFSLEGRGKLKYFWLSLWI